MPKAMLIATNDETTVTTFLSITRGPFQRRHKTVGNVDIGDRLYSFLEKKNPHYVVLYSNSSTGSMHEPVPSELSEEVQKVIHLAKVVCGDRPGS